MDKYYTAMVWRRSDERLSPSVIGEVCVMPSCRHAVMSPNSNWLRDAVRHLACVRGEPYTPRPNREHQHPLTPSPSPSPSPLYSDGRQMLDFLPLHCVIAPRDRSSPTSSLGFFFLFSFFHFYVFLLFGVASSIVDRRSFTVLRTILSPAVLAGSIFRFVSFRFASLRFALLCFGLVFCFVFKSRRNKCGGHIVSAPQVPKGAQPCEYRSYAYT